MLVSDGSSQRGRQNDAAVQGLGECFIDMQKALKKALWTVPTAIANFVVAWIVPGRVGDILKFTAVFVLALVVVILLSVLYAARKEQKRG